MGLNSSPSCCTALPLHQFFLYHSVSPPPCFSTSLGFFTSLCFSISVHSSSVFLLLPHTLFLSSSDFLPSLCLYLSSVLQFPSSSLLLLLSVSLLAYLYHLYLSCSISPFIFLIDLTSLSLPLFPFSLMIILTTLNFLWFQHLRYLRIGIW